MEKESIKRIIIGATFGFLLGFGSAWIYLDRSTGNVAGDIEVKKDESAENVDVEQQSSVNAKISIDEQASGDKVVVKRAELENPGWIVIYEDADGELGRILGARLFDKGVTLNREVFLLRSTASGSKYYALIHTDSGDGEFDYKDDIALSDENSERLVLTSFLVK